MRFSGTTAPDINYGWRRRIKSLNKPDFETLDDADLVLLLNEIIKAGTGSTIDKEYKDQVVREITRRDRARIQIVGLARNEILDDLAFKANTKGLEPIKTPLPDVHFRKP